MNSMGNAQEASATRRNNRQLPLPGGEKHWHGATPTSAMTHIAIQEKLDGKVVDWMEHVTDEQYRKGK